MIIIIIMALRLRRRGARQREAGEEAHGGNGAENLCRRLATGKVINLRVLGSGFRVDISGCWFGLEYVCLGVKLYMPCFLCLNNTESCRLLEEA